MENDKIEVGEFVRLDDGTIGKYQININWLDVVETNNKYIGFDIEKDILKHSKNIIDLIEVGDIVTYWLGVGYYTTRTVDVDFLKQIKDTFINKDIRSIVTKEQFKEMEYRV